MAQQKIRKMRREYDFDDREHYRNMREQRKNQRKQKSERIERDFASLVSNEVEDLDRF